MCYQRGNGRNLFTRSRALFKKTVFRIIDAGYVSAVFRAYTHIIIAYASRWQSSRLLLRDLARTTPMSCSCGGRPPVNCTSTAHRRLLLRTQHRAAVLGANFRSRTRIYFGAEEYCTRFGCRERVLGLSGGPEDDLVTVFRCTRHPRTSVATACTTNEYFTWRRRLSFSVQSEDEPYRTSKHFPLFAALVLGSGCCYSFRRSSVTPFSDFQL